MTQFRFSPVTPHLVLSPYIAKMYVFESTGRLPELDRKLIVPNANLKLTLTYRNGIAAQIGDHTFVQPEHKLSLSGLIDTPVSLDPTADAQTGTIIIEFNPLGAYRFFRLGYSEIKNQIVWLSGLTGNQAALLEEQLAGINEATLKLQLLQNWLIRWLEKTAADPIYDYCISRINESKGIISVAHLEKETGYTARWLHRKFSERLGTGPKNLAEIVRFKQFYEAYAAGRQDLKSKIYECYYDQSHFIKAFKRFTGTTPTELSHSLNELATRHYTS